jgi:hypothetical protein
LEPVKESCRSGANEYLLAVGSDHVFAIRTHPVEATTARHYVPRWGTVIDEDDVLAVSGAENVRGRGDGGEWCRGQTVVDHYEITGVDEYEPNVEVVEEASRGRFLHMLYQAVRT